MRSSWRTIVAGLVLALGAAVSALVGREHYDVATHVKAILQKNKELQDIIAILGVDELSEDDKVTVAFGSPRAHNQIF